MFPFLARLFAGISIHAPPRGATTGSAPVLSAFYFNSRPSARGDQRVHSAVKVFNDFNSRPSARGDDSINIRVLYSCNFNSRPSARGDSTVCRKVLRLDISIHAPPRGATQTVIFRCTVYRFQFTPLREGRHIWGIFQPFLYNFNSRPSARGDLSDVLGEGCPCRFQFTPLREGRRNPHSSKFCLIGFQFTPLREGRLDSGVTILYQADYFNSRPSARGDCIPRIRRLHQPISIHAPPRGATITRLRSNAISVFQFTPLREGRRGFFMCFLNFVDFNSRPSARGDSKRYAISANLLFNPYKSAWLNNRATQFVEIILVIFHRIIA